MQFTAPMPFAAAVARLESKTPVAAALTSAEWAQLQLGIRDRAFFSAQVENLRTLATMQGKFDSALTTMSDPEKSYMDRSKFIAEMRVALGAAPGDSGELTDLTSTNRLGLIYDFQIEDAREYGRWQAGQDSAILDEFPAQELLRVEDREEERDWSARWAEAGGEFFGGRMIALKNDPVWEKISRFGRPWPPFDFGSGMGVEDIDRDQAEAIGLLAPGDTVAPTEADFNTRLQASVPAATPALLEGFKAIFGEQVDVGRDGKITWQGQRVQKLYEQAISDPAVKWSLDLGQATADTLAKAKAAGVELPADTRLVLDADHVRHANNRHGVGETQADQRPLTALDFQLLPHAWRDPDTVRAGELPGDLVFDKTIVDRLVFATWRRAANGTVRLHSLLVKKEGGQP